MAFVVARFGLISLVFLVVSSVARRGTKLLFTARTKEERLFRRDILIVGGSIGLGYILQTAGLLTTTTSKSAFLTSTAVVWTPIISFFIGREKITAKLGSAVMLTLVGVLLLTQAWRAAQGGMAIGDLLTIGCAIAFGVYIVWIDRVMLHAREITGNGHAASLMVTSTQLVAATLLILVFLPVMETPHYSATPFSIGALIFTALIATGATAYLQARYQNVVTPSQAAVIYMIEPVVAMLIAEVFLTEQISFLDALGAVLIIAGVIIAQAPKRKDEPIKGMKNL